MKLIICTIVLDGLPWIAYHLPVFNKLSIDWEWHIAEGVSKPVADTGWCKGIPPRLSTDGTKEYLDSISRHPRVKVVRKEEWNGKTEQINACVKGVQPGDIVMQVDSDEMWTARQLELIVRILTSGGPENSCSFWCRYFVGPDIVITTRDCYAEHKAWEWRRAWKAQDDFRFTKHEPPEVNLTSTWHGNDHTASIGLVFDHYAYALESQVALKAKYYGHDYSNAVEQWRKLQLNTKWPARLGDFFPWVKDQTMVDKLYR